jgi:hypothetical protein
LIILSGWYQPEQHTGNVTIIFQLRERKTTGRHESKSKIGGKKTGEIEGKIKERVTLLRNYPFLNGIIVTPSHSQVTRHL